MRVKIFQQGEGPVNTVGGFLSKQDTLNVKGDGENLRNIWGVVRGSRKQRVCV